MFGDKQFAENPGYPTPETLPETTTCLVLQVPANAAWWAIYAGLLLTLCDESAWQQYEGGMSREDAALAAKTIYDEAMEFALGSSCATSVPTPYWDEEQDLDDEESVAEQTWYGEVTNPEAPPGELSFVENAGIWIITGFIAYSGNIAAAIYFRTIAPRFVLAWNKGDIREVFRVVVDAADYGTIDTDDYADGDIIELPVVPDDAEYHDITIVRIA